MGVFQACATAQRRAQGPAGSRGGVAVALATVSLLALTGCEGGFPSDWDLRRGDGFTTADAARDVSPGRPRPDDRGIITYPGYQVVVARRGETPQGIAQRLGIDAAALARHNALDTDTLLNGGETLVLPGSARAAAADTPGAGPQITETRLEGTPTTAAEPLRHTVERGETAFSIARLYNVTARALADWNGLPADMAVREGQVLLIPVPQSIAEAADDTRTAAAAPAGTDATPDPDPAPSPGTGSPTPAPPSAAEPLPAESPERTAGTDRATPAPESPPAADMAPQRTEGPRLAMPVDGRIVRAYQRGRNDGVGIGAPAGTVVRAAAAGEVAAITQDTDQVPIMVIRHADNLLTVYANIDDIRVARGDRVTRGQTIATVRRGDPSFLHFEVREGFESVDPMPYLQ